MRSLFAMLSLIVATAAPQFLSMLETDQPGGVFWCEGALMSVNCAGSVATSDCTPHQAKQFITVAGTYATNIKSQTTGPGDCVNYLDSLGAPCKPLLDDNILPFMSCTKRTL